MKYMFYFEHIGDAETALTALRTICPDVNAYVDGAGDYAVLVVVLEDLE